MFDQHTPTKTTVDGRISRIQSTHVLRSKAEYLSDVTKWISSMGNQETCAFVPVAGGLDDTTLDEGRVAHAKAQNALRQHPLKNDRIQRWRIRDRTEWMSWRKQDVTASSVGALFGVHQYQTHYGLWQEKAGRSSDQTLETAAMRRGRLLESVAINMLREDHPSWTVRASKLYYRDHMHHLGATPDCRVKDPGRPGWGNVQIKSADATVFERKWRNAAGQLEPPLWIVLQSLVEAHLSKASWAAVAVITPAFSGFNLDLIDIPLHPDLMKAVYQQVDAFWQSIQANVPPEPDFQRDADLFLKLRPEPNGSRIDLTNDTELPSLLEEDELLVAVLRAKTDRRKAIRAEVAQKLGAASYARFEGGYATSRVVERQGYTVPPSTYRDVRLKRADP